ncbi:unnamed protein product, partial [Effrenium voratum]
GCDDSCEDAWALDQLADSEDEEQLLEVTLLQTQLKKERGPSAQASEEHVLSRDHNGKVCMLCNQPLPERLGDRRYSVFRRDCGKHSGPTGPSLEAMATPAAELAGDKVAEGFCALNFAKSCTDAVANQDYLYFPKSIDFEHPSMSSNVRWDGRYCLLNGFLDRSVLELQQNFTALGARAKELCRTKYAKHGIERLNFLDMLQLSKQDDSNAPSIEEAELMAAWNCAMGDLGCDMAMCAYSFCDQGSGQPGLYGQCQGWDPVAGMPF